MAARKGSTGRKKKKTTSAKGQTRKKEVYDSRSMETEIILWIILAASAVLLVSNFGIGGAVGNAISSFFFGLVGLVCYPLPFFLFIGTAFVISNSRNPRAYRKMAGFALLFITACMFMQMITEGGLLEDDPSTYFDISARYKTGGGILGGVLCRLCVIAFGMAGAYAIIIAALMISLVLITQKSIFDMIRKFSRALYESAAKRQEKRREAARIRQEEEEKQEELEEKRRRRRERTVHDEESLNVPGGKKKREKKGRSQTRGTGLQDDPGEEQKEKTNWQSQYAKFDEAFLIACKEYGRQDLPIVTNMDFGHTVPQLILPYGITAEINPSLKTVSILEAAVS